MIFEIARSPMPGATRWSTTSPRRSRGPRTTQWRSSPCRRSNTCAFFGAASHAAPAVGDASATRRDRRLRHMFAPARAASAGRQRVARRQRRRHRPPRSSPPAARTRSGRTIRSTSSTARIFRRAQGHRPAQAMRWIHIARARRLRQCGDDDRHPLYSNTTLVGFSDDC